jgi:hypothetical protein
MDELVPFPTKWIKFCDTCRQFDRYAHSPPIKNDNVEYTQHLHTNPYGNSSPYAALPPPTPLQKRSPKRTSKVWEHSRYEENGVQKWRSRCKRGGCDDVMSMQSGRGMAHMKRHIFSHN